MVNLSRETLRTMVTNLMMPHLLMQEIRGWFLDEVVVSPGADLMHVRELSSPLVKQLIYHCGISMVGQ